ncbi:hypothetical protein AC249_AIPGENE28516 [Exaiptasia diaphana]|nr:hypothetical protein AC249_AIPGENE28516 [Exaiptasia diaphana]
MSVVYPSSLFLFISLMLNRSFLSLEFFSTDDFMCKPMRIVGETVICEVEEDRNSTSTNTLKSLKNIHTFVA